MNKEELKLGIIAFLSRLVVILLWIISSYIIPNHDNDGFKLYNSNIKNMNDVFGKWDAVHYVNIATYGYSYIESYAFFPGYPIAIKMFKEMLLSIVKFVGYENMTYNFNDDSEIDANDNNKRLTLICGIIISNFFFIIAAIILRRYYIQIMRTPIRLANIASICFCILNPASVFFSACYTESMFAVCTFSTLLNWNDHVLPIVEALWAVIPLTMGAWCRPNGIITFISPSLLAVNDLYQRYEKYSNMNKAATNETNNNDDNASNGSDKSQNVSDRRNEGSYYNTGTNSGNENNSNVSGRNATVNVSVSNSEHTKDTMVIRQQAVTSLPAFFEWIWINRSKYEANNDTSNTHVNNSENENNCNNNSIYNSNNSNRDLPFVASSRSRRPRPSPSRMLNLVVLCWLVSICPFYIIHNTIIRKQSHLLFNYDNIEQNHQNTFTSNSDRQMDDGIHNYNLLLPTKEKLLTHNRHTFKWIDVGLKRLSRAVQVTRDSISQMKRLINKEKRSRRRGRKQQQQQQMRKEEGDGNEEDILLLKSKIETEIDSGVSKASSNRGKKEHYYFSLYSWSCFRNLINWFTDSGWTRLQREKWNVGWLTMWHWRQIPNWLIASPMFYIIYLCMKRYNPSCFFPFHQWSIRQVLEWNPSSSLGVHLICSLMICLVYAHPQIITRLVCSSNPLIYLVIAEKIMQEKKILLNINNKNSIKSMNDSWTSSLLSLDNQRFPYMTIYCICYSLGGVIAHANGYPWT